MPWFRVCDTFAFDGRAVAAGNAAIGLWTRAGSWCAQQLSDGMVPEHMLAALGGTAASARKLVDVGLWEPVEEGYRFVEWKGVQPTRREIEQGRAGARARMRRARRSARRSTADRTDLDDEESPAVAEPTEPTQLDDDRSPGDSREGARQNGAAAASDSALPESGAPSSEDVRPNGDRTSEAVRSTHTRPSPPSSPSPPKSEPPADAEGGGGLSRAPDPRDQPPGAEARVLALAVLESLGPQWRIGASAAERLAPSVAAALYAGWTSEGLAKHLSASPEGVRSPYAVLSARLDDLPSPPAARRQRPDWCGTCDELTRMRETIDEQPFRCPTCHPAVVSDEPGGRVERPGPG